MGVELSHAVGTAWIKRGILDLRDGLDLAEHLGGAGLVEADLGVHEADGLEQIKAADTSDLGGGARLVKAHAHEALGGKVLDLVRLNLLNKCDAGTQVGEIVLDEVQVGV